MLNASLPIIRLCQGKMSKNILMVAIVKEGTHVDGAVTSLPGLNRQQPKASSFQALELLLFHPLHNF